MPNWSIAEADGLFCPLWLDQESQWAWTVDTLWERLGLIKPVIMTTNRRQGSTTYMFVHALAWFGGNLDSYRDIRIFMRDHSSRIWASKVLSSMLRTLGAEVEQATASSIRVRHCNGTVGNIRVFSEQEQPLPTRGLYGSIFLDSAVSTLTPVKEDNSIMPWLDMVRDGGCFSVAEDRVARRAHSMTPTGE